MTTAERWDQRADELPFPLAMLLSLLLSAVVVLVLLLCVPRPPRPVPKAPPIRVVLMQIPTRPVPVAPPPQALEPPPPVAIEVAAAPRATVTLPPKRPAVMRPQRPARMRVANHAQRELAQDAPAPPSATPVVQPAPAARPAPSDRAARDSLEARIKQAIQSAMHYPEAAREMGRQGTALVYFVYRDRSVHDVRIVRSSTSSILDAAALEAVRDAGMPAPGALAGRELALVVPVVFDLSESDD